MRLNRALALGASMLVLLSACSAGGGSKPTVRIGSVGFYESEVMAQIYGQALQANGYTVDFSALGIGTRKVAQPALESGQFDLEPEYIGSGLAYYEPGKQSGDPKANQTELQNVLNGKGGGITVLDYTPAVDTNAFVVRKDTATQFNLSKMSDLTAVQGQLKFGVATDCATNPVCGQALKDAYGLDLSKATLLSACDTPMAQALLGKTIDVAELCSTQPDIAVNGWVVLTDDKATQPADNIAPLVRNDLLAKVDKTSFEKILNDVSAKMDTATLTQLNKSIAIDKQDVAAVAKGWLQANGFVK
ncbi:MAG TPA: ABC transporter substrate-binding protein [Candidatus Binatia bacterium]|nr:ABC transporter substrate-binding protein [Candidatus Binatia bacterium]